GTRLRTAGNRPRRRPRPPHARHRPRASPPLGLPAGRAGQGNRSRWRTHRGPRCGTGRDGPECTAVLPRGRSAAARFAVTSRRLWGASMAGTAAANEAFTRELRIAPVMTGGTSLAVWMGGVTAELYRVLNARRDTRTST